MLSVSVSGFPHQVHNIRIKKKINIPSEWKLNSDRQFRSPPLGSQNFMSSLLLNTKFIKMESKIQPRIGIELEFSCMRYGSHNCYTSVLSRRYICLLITFSNNAGDISLRLSFPKSHTHHPEQHEPPIEQKSTTTGLIYKHSKRTELRHLACSRSEGELSNPLWLILD